MVVWIISCAAGGKKMGRKKIQQQFIAYILAQFETVLALSPVNVGTDMNRSRYEPKIIYSHHSLTRGQIKRRHVDK